MDLAVGQHLLEQQRGDEGEVAVAPHADFVAAFMRDFHKAGDGMYADGDDLRERRHIRIDALGQPDKAVGCDLIVFLQKAVCGAAAELAASQIVFSDIFVLFTGDIRHHDHFVAGSISTRRVKDDLSDALVDQRHRELFLEHLDVAGALIVALIGVADGQMRRAYDHAAVHIDIIERDLKPARCAQAVNCIDHTVSSLILISNKSSLTFLADNFA